MPRWILLSVVLCACSPAVAADEPRPLPATKSESTSSTPPSKLEHLRQAARHLREAGLDEVAGEIDRQAEALVRRSEVELGQKREQLERLRLEIAELERLAGIVQQIQISCRVIEIKQSQVNELGIGREAHFLNPGGKPVGPKPGESFAVLDSDSLDKRLERLETKVLVDSALVTNSGRPATMLAGGQFPVPTPTPDGKVAVEFRDFGTRIEALPRALGSERVRLDLAIENSSRDRDSGVTLAGLTVPGVTVRRVHTAVEMRLGETLAQTCRTLRKSEGTEDATEQDPIVTLFLVTPRACQVAAPRLGL